MPYQKIPKSLRPLYLKGLPASRILKQANHLDLIANYKNSAYKLPETVSKLQVIFKNHNAYGHMGMRQFWKFNLKTLSFHNASVPIEVQRIECATKDEQLKCPGVVKAYFADGRVETVQGKDKHSDDIMAELIKVTNAEKIPESEIALFTPKLQH